MRTISKAIETAFKQHSNVAKVDALEEERLFKIPEADVIITRAVSVLVITITKTIGSYRKGTKLFFPWSQILAAVQKLKSKDCFFANRIEINNLWAVDLNRIFYEVSDGALTIKFANE